jgi:hypothetical protein
MPDTRVPVSLEALIQRLIRQLIKGGKTIRSPRGRADRSTLGDYYLLDKDKNAVVEARLTPKRIVAMAREHGVLADWEEVR